MTGTEFIPIEGMTTRPYGLPEMAAAWLGLLLWARGVPEIVEKFEREAGHDIAALSSTGFDRMIDESKGRDKAVVIAWSDFVTREYWGEVGCQTDEEPTT